MNQRRWGRAPRRMLGLVAAPILIGSCAPTQCAPAPPPPPPVTAAPTTSPPPPPTTRPPAPRPTAPPTTTPRTTAPPTTAPRTTAPPTTAAPAAGKYAFLVTLPNGAYTRWDPCDDPITYRIDRTIVPTTAEEQAIRGALATAAAATGFRFQEVTSGAEAVIGIQDFPSAEYPSSTLGRGGGNFDRSTGEMSSGLAYVKDGLDASTLRYVLLHEIGHMLGLGHVRSEVELMHEWVVRPPKQQYASGDLEGLRRVGSTMECFPTQHLRTMSPQETIIVH